MLFSELLYDDEYTCDGAIGNMQVERISSSTEDMQTGDLFVLIKGINFDTGKIIDYILAKGPVAIVCDRDRAISASVPVIRVADARRALAFIYSRYYGICYDRMRFIAVTGTNGKTTTATMIKAILQHSGMKVGFIGTGKIEIANELISGNNYSMTTPDPKLLYSTIKRMENEGCGAVVMEVSSHALALGKVAPIPFYTAAFTNLSEEHLDFHTDISDYYKTKCKLFYQCKNGVFNADDEYSAKAMTELRGVCRIHSVGVLWDADAMARDVALEGFNGSTYIYREPNLIFKVYLNMPGNYNVYNSLLAIKCALVSGASPSSAREAIKELCGVEGRFEIIREEIEVIIDYAHTPKAFENLLKTVNSFKKQGQKVVTVFGCGGERDKEKRPKMARISERFSDFSIVTTDNSRGEREGDIIADILSGFERTEGRKVISTRSAAITSAILNADDGDIVVVLGKGHERYNIDRSGYHEFNEREIIKSALERRSGIKRNAH